MDAPVIASGFDDWRRVGFAVIYPASRCSILFAAGPDGKPAMHDRAFRYSEIYPERAALTPDQIARVPPAEHPAVRTHPPTGRQSVFLMKDMIRRIGDLDEGATNALVAEVEAFCTQQQGPQDILIGCAACYLNTHGAAEKIKSDVKLAGQVNEALGAAGLKYDEDRRVRHAC